jgi:hypothetical protein
MHPAGQENGLAVAHPYPVAIPGVIGEQGAIHFWEDKSLFPEGIKRCFWITGVREGGKRGNHAHRKESQVIVAITGSVEVYVLCLDGREFRFNLTHPSEGVYIPKLNWVEVTFWSEATVLVLSDHEFLEGDFIREKFYFEKLKKHIG